MNNPEYCQNIYEAAKKVVHHYHSDEDVSWNKYLTRMWTLILNLERALEGKENV